jgi:hypothetical protein
MAQQPDDIIVIQRILKLLKENYQNIGDTLEQGRNIINLGQKPRGAKD